MVRNLDQKVSLECSFSDPNRIVFQIEFTRPFFLIAEQLPEKEAMDTMNELDGSVKHLRNTLNNVVANFPNHSGVQN